MRGAESGVGESGLLSQERRGLFWNLMAVLAGRAGTLGFGLLAMIFTTRALGANDYGKLALFFMALNLLSDLIVHWPNQAVIRFGREELEKESSLSRTFWARMSMLVVALVAAAGVVLVAQRYLEAYIGLPRGGAAVLIVYLSFVCATDALGYVLQTQGRFRWYGFLSAATKALNAALIAGLILLGPVEGTVLNVLRLHLASLAVVLLMTCVAVRRRELLPMRLDLSRVGAMARYAWPLIFSGMAALVVNWVDVVVIQAYWSRSDVGAYSVSYQCVLVTGTLRVAVIAVLGPFIMSLKVRDRLDAINHYLDDLAPQGLWAAGLLMCGMAMFGEVIPLVCGDQFAASVLPFQVLAAGMTFQVLAMFYHGVACAFDRTRQVAVIGVTICVVNVAGDLLLVPSMGPLGAAVATSVAMAVGNLLFIPMLSRVEPLRSTGRRRRYLAVLGAVPCVAVALLAAEAAHASTRLMLSAGVVVVWLGVARWAGVFRRRALATVDQIAMPGFVRRFVHTWYRLFGSGERNAS